MAMKPSFTFSTSRKAMATMVSGEHAEHDAGEERVGDLGARHVAARGAVRAAAGPPP